MFRLAGRDSGVGSSALVGGDHILPSRTNRRSLGYARDDRNQLSVFSHLANRRLESSARVCRP